MHTKIECWPEIIFFDGLLPPKKKPIRLERLEACIKQIQAHSSMKRASLAASEVVKVDTPLEMTSAMLFHDYFPPLRSSMALPAAPFPVPSVLDALATSRFARVTQVVAGEADTFCALAAYDQGCFVLTSDSDLLVHDLGAGAVAFLSDMELQEQGDIKKLSAKAFRSQQVARRLEIDSILKASI